LKETELRRHNPVRRRELAACFGLTALSAASGTCAAVLDWQNPTRMTPIVARDMPLRDFVEALVAAQSIAVVVSPAASEKLVNGRFSGSPAVAFDSVVRSLSLLPYHDGGTLHIFTSNEVQRRTVAMSPSSAERVIATLNQLRLHDGRFNTFTAVPASGMLRVAGAKPFVDQVQEVVRSVQNSAAGNPEQIAVYKLRYAWAWDVSLTSAGRQIVVPGVATLLRTLLARSGVVSVSAPGKPASASAGKLKGQGFASGNTGEIADTRTSTMTSPAAGQPNATQTEDFMRGAGSPGPTVTAEVRTNSVIVRDTPDRLPQYAELVRSLDVEPLMVEIEATIVDVNSDRLIDLGVNWRLLGSTSETRLGSGSQLDLQLRGPNVTDVTPTGRGLVWSTVRDSGNLIARVTALAADGAARVISRAQIATMANLESSIQSSETAYVRVTGVQEVDLFPVTASTNVRVTPQVVTRQGRQIVSMVVAIRDGAFTDAVVDKIPSVKEVSLSTHGLVADNQTFVIGGFKQERSSRRADKIPLLGDIPVLGTLFRTTSDQSTQVQRMFLLQPRVLSVAALLERQSAEVPDMPEHRSPWFGKPQGGAAPRPTTKLTPSGDATASNAAPSAPDAFACFGGNPDPMRCHSR
jgi:type III secretion protein C